MQLLDASRPATLDQLSSRVPQTMLSLSSSVSRQPEAAELSGAVSVVHASPEVEEVVPWEQQTRQSPDLVENPPLRSQLT